MSDDSIRSEIARLRAELADAKVMLEAVTDATWHVGSVQYRIQARGHPRCVCTRATPSPEGVVVEGLRSDGTWRREGACGYFQSVGVLLSELKRQGLLPVPAREALADVPAPEE